MKFSHALVLLLCAASGEALANPALAGFEVRLDDGRYLASVRLEGGLTPELLEEIEAGLETTVGYRLQLYRRRTGFLDALVARHHIACSVRRDSLTRQFTLTRRVDGEIADTRVTDDPEEMHAFLTILRDVPLAEVSALQEGRSYYAKAKSDLGLVWRFYLIPWSLDTAWVRAEVTPPPGKVHASQP